MAKSKVNAAGNYTKPEMRKSLYQQINQIPTDINRWATQLQYR